MYWNEWTQSQRPTRPTYLPPHLRGQPAITDSISSSSSRSPRFIRGRGLGRGSRSRGPNQDRSWGGGSRGSWRFRAQPFRSSEGFDELEVVEKGLSNVHLDAYDETPVASYGFDVPSLVTSFADVHFSAALMENIKRCNYVKPTPIQRYAIPVAMAGRDLMASAQTGSGKTAAFCFPIISGVLKHHAKTPAQMLAEGRGMNLNMACPLALILAPTRELSCEIHDEAKKFAYKTGVKIVVAYGGAPIVQQFRNLERGVDILVATPGRVVDMIERARVSLRNVKFLALDEADRMLDMGFEPQVRRIVQEMEMPRADVRQTMLFSATFPTEIQKLASDFLSNYIFLSAGKVGSSTDLIAQKVQFVADMDKKSRLMSLLISQRSNGSQEKPILTLVFVETKRGADALQLWLSMKGFPSIAIHGDKVQLERERALRSFRTGVTPILVATDVAARGLDIPHVAHVINYDLPRDIDAYVHRIGRTGRAGKSGLATAFFSDKNVPLAKALVEVMVEANQEVPSWLLEYAETYSSSEGFTPGVKRNSGLKFGGSDYRRGASSGNERYDYLNQIADPRDVQPYGDGASSLYSCRSSCAGYYIPSASDGLYSHMYGYHPFDACLSGIDVSSLPCKGTATMAVIYPGGILIGGDSRYNRKYTNFPDFVQYGDYPYKIHQLHPFLMATVAGLLTFAADAIIMLESRADNYAKSHNYSPMPVLTAAQELFKIIQDAIRAGRFERGSVHTEFLVAGFEWDKPSIYKVDEYNIYPSHKHADIQGFQWVNSGTGGTILEGYVVDRCKRTGLTEEVHLTESIILGLLATTLQDKDTGNTATVQKISEYGCKPMFYRLSLPKLLNAGVNPNNFL